ncbi:DUF1302 family protein [Thauera sp.]|jgi:hypothetical protein|uniref:DUF1302 family protein n=1 Tax=Thauera sp. TaxID=1905334 RepID=UPI002B8C222C|nr:DUF1302 family protein [Thauera sp.]HRO35314.1 hypothetical protein [Thauera sp.]
MQFSKKLPCLTILALLLGAFASPVRALQPSAESSMVAAEEVEEVLADEPETEGTESDAELDALLDVGAPASAEGAAHGLKWSGYTELGAAYTYRDPERWSRLRARGELGVSGQLAPRVKWRLSARAEADGAFDLEDEHYPAAVRRDRRTDFVLREAYVDLGHGDWEFRLGRQHVVWGEMVGFFFADVVSARDMRDFLLPELESMRIGQWALRAEHFGSDTHLEFLWVPKPGFDEIGEPGSDFFSFPWLPAGTVLDEDRPGQDLDGSNWGARVSRLVDGWDLSAFYYRSYDISPTLYSLNQGVAHLRHDRIGQVGGTFSKDLGSFVLKGEAVHTHGRSLNTFPPGGGVGLQATDMIDYALGVDVPVGDWRFNVQYYGRWLEEHLPVMMTDRHEQGVTLQVVHGTGTNVEAEILAISSVNRSDHLIRPKLTWKFAPAWRVVGGVDVFGGNGRGLFSQYDRNDRAYVELRHVF